MPIYTLASEPRNDHIISGAQIGTTDLIDSNEINAIDFFLRIASQSWA